MKYKYMPAKKDGRFECQGHTVKEGFFWDTAASLVKSLCRRFRSQKKEVIDWYVPEVPKISSQELRVTWIGHATVLIQVAGYNILTDPIFGSSSFLYPRIIRPGIELDELPRIDFVFISHNHYDHMEAKSIRALHRKNPAIEFFVPHGDKSWFKKRGIFNATECMWWENKRVSEIMACTFLPSVHWTQRNFFDRNRSLWGSWALEVEGYTIYFGGDTAFGPHFTSIAREFPFIDLAILPIGPCEPRNAMKHAHMDSCEAIQAYKFLKAQNFFPIHWGTFRFGNEVPRLPLDRLQEQWSTLVIEKEAHLIIPKAGQSYNIQSKKLFSESVPAVKIDL